MVNARSQQAPGPWEYFNLETAGGRKKDAEGFGVPAEINKFVVTLWVMRHFLILRGAPRACVDFCDPTAVSRFNRQDMFECIWG
jgi:hypothetical protein